MLNNCLPGTTGVVGTLLHVHNCELKCIEYNTHGGWGLRKHESLHLSQTFNTDMYFGDNRYNKENTYTKQNNRRTGMTESAGINILL